ncbi:NAD(P)-dependent alcohol dehydrogenase [Streptomyces sp. SL13]|uniref:NAD(P)-dependent alcohol dehydrogenase n=1 Tax=Streptantibioticus silvisoli TaxID=2705255 RepID=A0AA90H1Q1_9ACTN|nr:NAD(P)-dependent alcohol dehydrogenase [Streptantibioticus silvisoli]MDI5969259.1 NAD(P)-dependent alcohol dehydrogenase [Streptantibioticus silvisoli]
MSGVTGSVPDSMRACVLHQPRDLRLEERAAPRPERGEVVVRVRSVGVCGSDVHYYEHGRIGDFVVRQPLVLGHEASGDIVATGPGVPADRIGERVAIEPGFPCRSCDQCRHGRYNLCPDIAFFGTPPVDGALCDYVRVPADFAHPIPDALSYDAAGLLEPLSVGIWANRKAGTVPGGSVLIAGAGPIGLVTAQIARAMGATEVVVTDIGAERLGVAAELGATGTVLAGAESTGTGFDAFVDCSGAAPAIDAGIRAVRPAGTAVLVGMGADRLTLPLGVLQNREINLTGTFRYANTWPAAIALASSGAIRLDRMVTGHFGLDDTESALLAGADPRHIKSVVTLGG